jgi:hypothetical protein
MKFINANELHRKSGGMGHRAFACGERRTAGPSAPSGFPVRLSGVGKTSCGFPLRKPHTWPLVGAACRKSGVRSMTNRRLGR